MDDDKRGREKFLYLPEAHNDYFILGGADQPDGPVSTPEPVSTPGPAPAPVPKGPAGIYPCPCCGYLTLRAPKEAAIAYICPVCFWENDVFGPGEDDHSDENGGMTLCQGRENYKKYGAVRPGLVQYARPPLPEEFPPDLRTSPNKSPKNGD